MARACLAERMINTADLIPEDPVLTEVRPCEALTWLQSVQFSLVLYLLSRVTT